MAASQGSSSGFANLNPFIVLIVLLLEICFAVIMIPERAIQSMLVKERGMMVQYIGDDATKQIVERSEDLFQSWFADSGVIQKSIDMFIPTSKQQARSQGMQKLGLREGFFPWLEKRIYSFWTMVFCATERLIIILSWLPVLSLFMVAALFDGWCSRSVKLLGFGGTSAPMFGLARYLLVIGLIAPFVYAFCPMTVHPVLVPLWGTAMAFVLMLKASNLQRF